MHKPRVGIDFHVVDGFFQGSRTHVLQLFSRVIQISPEIDFYLFQDNPKVLRDYSNSFSLPNVHLIRMPTTNPVLRLCGQLPHLQKKYGLDLMHMQNILPFPSLSPCMVTIHDILFEAYPQFFPRFFRFRSKILMRSAAVKSAHVFTVSNYSKNEIINQYSVLPDKITVLYNGVDTSKFYPGDDGKLKIESCGLRTGGYVLTVGRLDARKNHVLLLEAYAKLKNDAPDLVIAGQRDFRYEKIYEAVQRLRLHSRVRIMENVEDDLLPALYRHAKFFVYPTWAEGFGMPPLEAMASGIPVISSNTTALPEILGDNVVLIDPGSVVELTAAMERLLSDVTMTNEMKLYGPKRAKSFRWEVSARKVHDEYLSYFNGLR